MFDMPKAVLLKLLTVLHTAPQQLTATERALAERICHCCLCDALWIRRKKKTPERCVNCHKRGWDRPLLEALLAAIPKPTHPQSQGESS